MKSLGPVDVDHDFENLCVCVEFEDGSINKYPMRPVSRDEAISLIRQYVSEKLKRDDAINNLPTLNYLANHEGKQDYEIADDLISITNDYGYYIPWPNNNRKTGVTQLSRKNAKNNE